MKDELQSTLAGSYTIERELGGGGQSRVFLARDLALDRDVVIKVLPPETAGTVSAERFNREIRLAAQLQHAHIVPVLSAGTSAGLPFSRCRWCREKRFARGWNAKAHFL